MKNSISIWVLKKIFKEEKKMVDNADKNNPTFQTDAKFENKDKSHLSLLPYQDEKGLHLTKSLKKKIKKTFTQHS